MVSAAGVLFERPSFTYDERRRIHTATVPITPSAKRSDTVGLIFNGGVGYETPMGAETKGDEHLCAPLSTGQVASDH